LEKPKAFPWALVDDDWYDWGRGKKKHSKDKRKAQGSHAETNEPKEDISGTRKTVSFRGSNNRRQLPPVPHELRDGPARYLSARSTHSIATYSGFNQSIHDRTDEASDDDCSQNSDRSLSDSRMKGMDDNSARPPVPSEQQRQRPNELNSSSFVSPLNDRRSSYAGLPMSSDMNTFNPFYAMMPYQPSGLYPPIPGHHLYPPPFYSPGSALSRVPERGDDRIAPLEAQLRAMHQQIAHQEITRAKEKAEEERRRELEEQARAKEKAEEKRSRELEEEARANAKEEEEQAKRRFVNLERLERFIEKQNEKALQLETRAQNAEATADKAARQLAEVKRTAQHSASEQQQALKLAQETAERATRIATEAEQVASKKQSDAMKFVQKEVETAAKLRTECEERAAKLRTEHEERAAKLRTEHEERAAKLRIEYEERLKAEIDAKEKAETAQKEAERKVQELRATQQQNVPAWTHTHFAPTREIYVEEDLSSVASSQDSSSTITDTVTQATESTPRTRSGIVRVNQEDLDSDPSQMIIFPSRMGWKEHEYKVLTKSMLRFGFRPLVEEGAETPCVPSQFYERPGSGGCGLRGTALWHPPGPSLASDLYTSFLKSGWKPSYVRSNGKHHPLLRICDLELTGHVKEYGETWFLGRQPVHVILFTINYIPQAMIDDPSHLDHQYAEEGKLYISKEWVEKDALDEIGYKYTILPDWRVSLDPKLTHADIETAVARSFLLRETRLRKRYRDFTPSGNSSNRRIEDLGSELGDARSSSGSLLSVNKPSRFRSFMSRSNSRASGASQV
jgi:hypothetical protein